MTRSAQLTGLSCGLAVALTGLVASPAAAQQRTGWLNEVSGLAAWQGDADLSGGGDFSASRVFARFGTIYAFENGVSAGLALSVGQLNYDFNVAGAAPWGDVRDIRLSVPVRFRAGERATVFVAPQARWDYETSASSSNADTYGFFGGVTWQINERLRIGPALGAFTELEGSDWTVFPALLVDWQINDRWSLSTGSGVGATQGPGLSLSYAINDSLNLSLGARYEQVQFRLDNVGVAPGGVGEDSSIPVVLGLSYNPNPGISVSGFIGAEFEGELKLENAAGGTVSKQSYDTAPVAGVAVRLRF